MTVTYRYIGKGTTDSSGVAHITEDANGDPISPPGLVGVGAGEIDVIASVDKPISSGSVVSQPIPVLDCIKYDKGLSATGEHTDIWETSSNAKLDRYEEYSTVTEIDSSLSSDGAVITSGLTNSCAIELEVAYMNGTMGNGILALYDDNTYKTYFSLQNLGYPNVENFNWFKLKITVSDTTITCTDMEDNTKTSIKTITGSVDKFRVYTGTNVTGVKFRNVKIYPI